MGEVAITALVYVANSNPKTPINGATFFGLVGDPAGAEAIANGEYILSFDDAETGEITCSAYGYLPETQKVVNPAPVELSFPMEKPPGAVIGGEILCAFSLTSIMMPIRLLQPILQY